MNWLQFAVQWTHVLLAIVWFGYAISMYFLVSPAIATLPEQPQRDLNLRLGEVGTRVFPIVAPLVILLGIVRGTVFGPINSFGDIGTGYGIVFLVSLIVAVGLIVNGARNIGPSYRALKDASDVGAAAARLRRLAAIDLVGFLVVFTCMILMRFGGL